MFAAIAPSYDLNNRLFSLGIDQRWRRKAVKLSRLKADDVVVDVACGTGDLTLVYANKLLKRRGVPAGRNPYSIDYGQVIGIDYTMRMLPIARDKAGIYACCGNFHRPGLRVN